MIDLDKLEDKLEWSGFDRNQSYHIIKELIEEVRHLRDHLEEGGIGTDRAYDPRGCECGYDANGSYITCLVHDTN